MFVFFCFFYDQMKDPKSLFPQCPSCVSCVCVPVSRFATARARVVPSELSGGQKRLLLLLFDEALPKIDQIVSAVHSRPMELKNAQLQ